MREPSPGEIRPRDISFLLQQLIRGRSNAVGSVTLDENVASTTVTRDNMNLNAAVFFSPETANAAAEQGNGTMYVSSITKSGFVITHANNAQTDRTFGYVVLGG
jgi:hypothetical protein